MLYSVSSLVANWPMTETGLFHLENLHRMLMDSVKIYTKI